MALVIRVRDPLKVLRVPVLPGVVNNLSVLESPIPLQQTTLVWQHLVSLPGVPLNVLPASVRL